MIDWYFQFHFGFPLIAWLFLGISVASLSPVAIWLFSNRGTPSNLKVKTHADLGALADSLYTTYCKRSEESKCDLHDVCFAGGRPNPIAINRECSRDEHKQVFSQLR